MEMAVGLAPDRGDLLSNLGFVLWRLGRPKDAERACGRAIRLAPDHAPAHNNLALALQDLANQDAAVASFRAAARLAPSEPLFHNNLGFALQKQGRLEEAAAQYRAALALQPDYVDAIHNLAVSLHQMGGLDEAVRLYKRGLRIQPLNPALHNNLGRALHSAGDGQAAIRAFHEAIRLQPDYADAFNNLGNAFRELGMPEHALQAFRQVERLEPEFKGIHNNIALVLDELGNVEGAIEHYRREIQRNPNEPAVIANALRPLAEICAWDEVEDLRERLRRLTIEAEAMSAPFIWLTIPCSPAEQLHAAQTWVSRKYGAIEHLRPQLGFTFNRPHRDVLRIGYISADFRDHAVGRLLVDLIETHDRQQASVSGYSTGLEDGSDTRTRFAAAFDTFVDVETWSGLEIARRIYADGIDILVDLTGHTMGARTEVLAMRPAPVQVNFLGHPGTMGAPFVDFVVTDRFLTPPDQQRFYTERFAYLPDCYQPNAPRTASESVPSRSEVGLPDAGFVFCSFNSPYKITRQVWQVWMRILDQTEGSVLWLQGRSDTAAANLRAQAAKSGLDPDRVVFSPRRPYAEYLALYRLADLFLDTFPYNAGATASDALWMSLPVLTCPGQTYVSRMAGSLVRAIGVPQLIMDSPNAYEAEAVSLAHDPQRLAGFRAKLEVNRRSSPLFDIRRYAANLEDTYDWMWEQTGRSRI